MKTMLRYDKFLELVNELGFMAMNDVLAGFPSINDYIAEGQYWTDDPDIDPWIWKDRVAAEKKLLYGTFFCGKKGIISPRFFNIFYCAFHPSSTMEERYEAGKLSKHEWDIWELMNKEGKALGTHEIRKFLGVSPKSGASSVDTALVNMQMSFDIVIAGNTDMLDKDNKPYNKAIQYDRLDRWIPDAWFQSNQIMDHTEALSIIYKRAYEISKDVDMDNIKKVFNKQLKIYKRLQ